MKKVVKWSGGLLLVVTVLALCASAMGGPAPSKPAAAPAAGGAAPVALAEKVFLIDDFESGNIKGPREWWTFELAKVEAVANKELTAGDSKIAGLVGNYSLLLSGTAKNWYGGGCGTYIAKEGVDLSKYAYFQADIYGNGAGSGSLKVERVDDDNTNWQAEQDRPDQGRQVHLRDQGRLDRLEAGQHPAGRFYRREPNGRRRHLEPAAAERLGRSAPAAVHLPGRLRQGEDQFQRRQRGADH
jgi:hypothetical protein